MEFISIWRDESGATESFHVLGRAATGTVIGNLSRMEPRCLEVLLPPPAVAALAEAARQGYSCSLLLEESLPDSWQRFAWEDLPFSGRPLGNQLLVVRRARATFGNNRPPSPKPARWLNLFPRNEHDFTEELAGLVEDGRLRPCHPHYLVETIDTGPELFVLAHGDERGLQDRGGHPFDLSGAPALPRRVWLLACNRDHAMDALAQALLHRGVRTVVLARGNLSAPQMSGVVREWLTSGCTDPAAWLASVRNGCRMEGGLQALTVFGETTLDDGPSASWNRLTWELRHGWNPRLPLDDETTREDFQAADAVLDVEGTWSLTREWMLPPLLWLAEKYDHLRMQELEARLGSADAPDALRALAAAARRIGHYPQMARHLSRSLADHHLSDQERSEQLGALANLLIDLDLPESAAKVSDLHEDCIVDDPATRQMADYKRMDWRARIAARQGRLHVSLDIMGRKRRLASIDTGRELAWQTYLAAWGLVAGQVLPSVAEAFASEARRWLTAIDRSALGRGNEAAAYLLRAVSAHAWAACDRKSLEEALSWLPVAEERLEDCDPGPWAYSLAYLHLVSAANAPLFERAMAALEGARYFLEAATFLALAGAQGRHDTLVKRFQARRLHTIAELHPCLAHLGMAAIRDETAARTSLEIYATTVPAKLAENGTLPL